MRHTLRFEPFEILVLKNGGLNGDRRFGGGRPVI